MTPMEPIRSSTDLAFLRRTRGEIEAHLETFERWTEIMRSMTRHSEEVGAALADTGQSARLRMLLQEIDQRIAMLIPAQFSPEEPSVQPQKPAA